MAVNRRYDTKLRTLAAVAGGAAVVALGVVGAASSGNAPATTPSVVSVGEMTLGNTVTADYTETSVQTSVAAPTEKASPPCGFNTAC
jgi:hypothetical protein